MGTRSLFEAIRAGDAAAVRALLSAGTNINARNGNGLTPLMEAAFYGHADVARLLLEKGANPRYEDISGLTASDWALRRGHPEIAHMLRTVAEGRRSAAAEPQPAETDADRPGAEEINRLAHELEAVRVAAAEERRRAEEAEAGRLAAEQARRRAEEDAARNMREAARLTLEVEGAKKTAEEWSRKANEAETARRRAEEEARLSAAEAVRLARDLEAATRRSVELTRKRGDVDVSRVGTEAERQQPVPTPDPAKQSRGNYLVILTVIIGLFGGGLIGVLIVSSLNPAAPPARNDAQTAQASREAAAERVSVSGELRGRELTLPAPEYPERASFEGITGTVSVRVEVGSNGDVVSARALDGHLLLQQAAVRAARRSKFTPQTSTGRAGKMSGTITYSFPPASAR